ncbi:Receptor-type guanylate cyclase gcy-2 [Trichinella pseudospiralis]
MINSSRGQFSPTKRCSQALLGRFGINQENISTGNKQQTTHCGQGDILAYSDEPLVKLSNRKEECETLCGMIGSIWESTREPRSTTAGFATQMTTRSNVIQLTRLSDFCLLFPPSSFVF